MRKCLLLLPLVLAAIWQNSLACTTFFLERNGQMVFGRNYDWVTGTGMVHTNLRGLSKTSFSLNESNTISWVSRYGSTTFNQYGKEFPTGGMNEKGLVVELMWLSESGYPPADERPGMTVLQWIQYQLDNCATIEEVVATDKKIRIIPTGTPQHYLVADARGKVATIEYLNGKMVIHTGKDLPFPVLTNSTYRQSVEHMKPVSTSGNRGATFNDNSIERFTKACSMVRQYGQSNNDTPLVDYSFSILKNVAQGQFTKWSIVYDISNRKIYFKTQANPQLKFFNLEDLSFSCIPGAVSFDMNQDKSGNITAEFRPFSPETNRKMALNAFKESSQEVKIPDDLKESSVRYANAVSCR